jgi:hypothetical protein
MVGALSPKPFEDHPMIVRMRGPSVAQSVTPVCDGFAFFQIQMLNPGQIAAIGHVSALEARELRSSRQQTNGKA